MGLAFSRIWERMIGKKEMRILMVNDFVKNYRVHPTHWLISTQAVATESNAKSFFAASAASLTSK